MLAALTLALGLSAGSFIADVPRSASLLNQVPPPPALVDLEGIRSEIALLEAERPGLGGPITLLVSGGVLSLGSLVSGFFGLVLALFGQPALLFVSAAVLVVGVGLLVIGGVLLGIANRERSRLNGEIRALRLQLESPAPGPDVPLPPMPSMPPPSVELMPVPMVQLAVF